LWFVSYCIFFGALLLSNNRIQGAFAIKLGKQIKESNFIGNPFFELGKDSSNCEMTTAGSSVVYPKYMDMIGHTPLIDISSLVKNPKCPGIRVLGKAEFLNPGFSMKDRIVSHILRKALEDGTLKVGGTVVCASSGNTGASVAMLSATLGLNAVIITSPKCSKEKMSAIKAYGATLHIEDDYMGAEVRLARENPTWLSFDQYNNCRNSEAHYLGTGTEVWEQTHGEVTHFVMSGSTGGTISGVGRRLKEYDPNVNIVLADPYGSIFHQYHNEGTTNKPTQKTEIEGAGKEELPGVIDFNYIDDVVQVTDADAFSMCKELACSEGILVGGSAGLNAYAAIRLAEQMEQPCTIVTILCDMGIKYLSKVYDDDWLMKKDLYRDLEAVRMKGHQDDEKIRSKL